MLPSLECCPPSLLPTSPEFHSAKWSCLAEELIWKCKGLAPLLQSGTNLKGHSSSSSVPWDNLRPFLWLKSRSTSPIAKPCSSYSLTSAVPRSTPTSNACSQIPASPGTGLLTLRKWNLQSWKLNVLVNVSGLITIIEIIGCFLNPSKKKQENYLKWNKNGLDKEQ